MKLIKNMNNIQDDIKQLLDIHAHHMVNCFKNLTIKYEYCAERGIYLMSYYPDKLPYYEEFAEETMKFADKINITYNELNAPLFCDNEKLFKLSKNAITIC